MTQRAICALIALAFCGCTGDDGNTDGGFNDAAPDADIGVAYWNADYAISWECLGTSCGQTQCNPALCMDGGAFRADAVAVRELTESSPGWAYFWASAGPTYAGDAGHLLGQPDPRHLNFAGWLSTQCGTLDFQLTRTVGDTFSGELDCLQVATGKRSTYRLTIERQPEITLPDAP